MLELKKVCKQHDDKVLFKDCDLFIKKGEFLVVRGKSGCGKTTLLNMIGSLEKPDSGEILYKDHSIFGRKEQREYLRNEVGFLFQNYALIERKTVKENLEIVNRRYRSDYTIEQSLQFAGIDINLLNKKVYKLSGGEMQRVAMARLLMKKCSIVLADEPTGSLDYDNKRKIVELLIELNSFGKTIVLVTHEDIYFEYGLKTVYIDRGDKNAAFE